MALITKNCTTVGSQAAAQAASPCNNTEKAGDAYTNLNVKKQNYCNICVKPHNRTCV